MMPYPFLFASPKAKSLLIELDFDNDTPVVYCEMEVDLDIEDRFLKVNVALDNYDSFHVLRGVETAIHAMLNGLAANPDVKAMSNAARDKRFPNHTTPR